MALRIGRSRALAVAEPFGAPAEVGDEPAAHVVVVAPDVRIARELVARLDAAGLRVDRGASAHDVAFAVSVLPAPRVVMVAVDDMLERARVRRALAADPRWACVPVLHIGYGGLPLDAVEAVVSDYRAESAGAGLPV